MGTIEILYDDDDDDDDGGHCWLRSGFSIANQINFDLQLSDLQSFS